MHLKHFENVNVFMYVHVINEKLDDDKPCFKFSAGYCVPEASFRSKMMIFLVSNGLTEELPCTAGWHAHHFQHRFVAALPSTVILRSGIWLFVEGHLKRMREY